MSVAFAINHGCAVSCLAYATAELGNQMGSVSSGILYVGYAVTAFLFAKPLVAAIGSKLGTCQSQYSTPPLHCRLIHLKRFQRFVHSHYFCLIIFTIITHKCLSLQV
jgi:hypothetical protein